MKFSVKIDPTTVSFVILFIVFTNLWLLIVLMSRFKKLEIAQECKHSECRTWWANATHAIHLLIARREGAADVFLERMRDQVHQNQSSYSDSKNNESK